MRHRAQTNKNNKFTKLLAKLQVAVCLVLFFVASPVYATLQDEKNLKDQEVARLQSQIIELQKKEATVNNELQITNIKIQEIQAKIDLFQADINLRNQEISGLDNKIIESSNKLDQQQIYLREYFKTSYVEEQTSFIENLFSSKSFSDFINKSEYINSVQSHIQDTLSEINILKDQLLNNKQNIEKSRNEIISLQEEQLNQKGLLDKEKIYQESLISDTRYQKNRDISLAEQKKIESDNLEYLIKHPPAPPAPATPPTTPPSGGNLSSVPILYQNSGSWADGIGDDDYINNSRKPYSAPPSPVWKYGCGITSLAMIFNYYGYGVNPGQIATNPGFFSTGWDWDLISWNGIYSSTGGKFTATKSYDALRADSYATSSKPFMTYVWLSAYNTNHFVVITGKTASGQWIMNDPVFGGNKIFNYSAIENYVFIENNY